MRAEMMTTSSVELRISHTDECACGISYSPPRELPPETCTHYVECDWGVIEHTEVRPDRGEVGHLVTRKYFDCLATDVENHRRYVEREIDPDGRVRWQEFTASIHDDGRRFLTTAWPIYSHGEGIQQDDGSELPPAPIQRWTWEIFDAHWLARPSELQPLYIGRWPD